MDWRLSVGCERVTSKERYVNIQGLAYERGVTSRTTRASSICLQVLTLPPRHRASAHRHFGVETAGFVFSGSLELWFGEDLEECLLIEAGCYSYIPPGIPHLVANPSEDVECIVAVTHGAGTPEVGIDLLDSLEIRFAQRHPQYSSIVVPVAKKVANG